MKTEKEQARFWYVHARVGSRPVTLAVSAWTERQARRQARKRLGAGGAHPGSESSGVCPCVGARSRVDEALAVVGVR